jgi:lycopene beta-cyclase
LKKYYDLVFVGGGLANSLAVFRLRQLRPELECLLLESGPTYGGEHTWSFHHTDLTDVQHSWVRPFVSASWPGTDVRFPAFERSLSTAYHSIRSTRLQEVLGSTLTTQIALNTKVRDIFPEFVALENGVKVHAGCIIDGRGWETNPARSAPPRLAYQKFLGLDVTLTAPHGLRRPVLMDATVSQLDGFRFFYVLPWTETSLLIEDTRYSDTPVIDEPALRAEVLRYADANGWSITSVDRTEVGCLPIPLEGSLPAWDPGLSRSGARAGLFHATTGYSLPDAVRFADALAEQGTLTAAGAFEWTRSRAERHWNEQSYFRLLNRMMFQAADPENRYRILQQFYRQSDGLISRFYAGRLTRLDRLRLLSGRPPVSLNRAIRCLFERRRAA